MSDIIQLLPDSVANQIAAGEVIQRPASVIKELVENSVDAGATVINVLVVDAGRTSIQVTDNGKGMSDTDARLSFERHATSKIRQADDLFALHTMGFRGEALASIAAVAQVELKTRQQSDEVGTQLTIAGSRFLGQEPCSCPVGSNFKVENLFFNVPARRKFLKSNTTELNNIIAAFQRIVLVYPALSFTLHSNDTELINLRAGNLRQRIVDVFGKRLNQDLLSVNVETTLCSIHGFVGKPESARKKGAHQYFFVNGRYMKHPYFAKAVMSAFERLAPQGEQVPFFLYFEVAPENIDVNIHPTKTEIKFENEQAIWQILSAAVREAVGMFNDVPAIDFDTVGKPDIPVFSGSDAEVSAPRVAYNPGYNPFSQPSPTTSLSASPGSWQRESSVPDRWQELYEGLGRSSQSRETVIFADEEVRSAASGADAHSVISEKSPAHYQYKGKYIMTAVKSGLMIIDQHRAHVRILYEQYLDRLQAHKCESQKVLFPEVVELSAAGGVLMQKMMPELEALGFELTPMGGNSYAINAVPAGVDGVDYVRLVTEMLDDAADKSSDSSEAIRRSLALSLARSMAIPYGQVLGNAEMENVVNSLFACSNVNYAPDGRKVLAILRQQEIDHLLD